MAEQSSSHLYSVRNVFSLMIARIGLSDPSDPIRDEAGINNGWIKVIRLEAGYPMVELAVHHNVTQTKKNHTKSTKMLSFPSESIILI